MMKILYSGFIDKNHSSFGGYDKIINIDLPKSVLLMESYYRRWKPKGLLSRLPEITLEIVTNLKRFQYDITHFYYGDVTKLPFLPFPKSKKHKSVISIHLDIQNRRRFKKSFIKMLRSFDGVIVLSTQQKQLLAGLGIKSEFIPHGFSEPHFRLKIPKDINGNLFNESLINILVIGRMYRDFDLVREIVKKYANKNELKFHLIGAPHSETKKFLDYQNMSIYDRLDNDEYYTLIKKADYNFLPVTFATANNTLLECQYLNLPSILPSISGITDYAASEPLNFFYKEKKELYLIFQNLDKRTKNNDLKEFAKTHFDWEIIYKRLLDYYENVLRGE